ncbi:MAG: endonuclease [Pseudomonadales bacterium]
MATPSKRARVKTLLDGYGVTVAEQLRIPVAKNTPAPLFQLLNAALLLSARISADNALRAARALIDAGLTTPQKMVSASWQDRVDVITWHGYKRYDERTATMLGDTAQRLLDDYGGDLRRLREAAQRDPQQEKKLLTGFGGIGPTGADIFLREVQVAWEEVYPYADARVLKSAQRLNLGDTPGALARHTSRQDLPRLAAALLRVDLQNAYDEVMKAA